MVGYVGNPTDIPVVIVVPLGDASQAKAISSLLVNGTSESAEGEGASSACSRRCIYCPSGRRSLQGDRAASGGGSGVARYCEPTAR